MMCVVFCCTMQLVLVVRESSFNMTRGDEDIEGGHQKFLDTQKGPLKKLGVAPKICILQIQQEVRGGS